MTALTGGEAVVRRLEMHGVRHVFGIPGDHTVPIYAALAQSRIVHCTVRHEQGAGFMADGYYRASGKPGVAIVIGGPGVTNIATALAEANADRASMLVVSADTPTIDRGQGRDHNHELPDQQASMATFCAWSERVDSVAAIGPAIDRAFQRFRSGPACSVHVGIPIDILQERGQAEDARPCSELPQAQPLPHLDEALALLRAAERPLIVLGGGARAGVGQAIAFAERLDAPVMTTWSGTDCFPHDHPLWVGGGFHLSAARSALADADVVVAVGTQLGRSDFWIEPARIPGSLIRIDLDPRQLNVNVTSTVGIAADAAEALAGMTVGLPVFGDEGSVRASDWRKQLDDEAGPGGALYQPWLQALRAALPDNSVIAADSTLVTYLGFRSMGIPRGGSFLYPNAYGTLGYALPAAIGAKIAQPERPAAVIIGDGGFLFTCSELLTASENQLGLPVVVWNDRGYGCIRAGMIDQGVTPLGVSFSIPDLAALAAGFACGYVRAQSPEHLKQTVEATITGTKPVVIEVTVDTARQLLDASPGEVR